MQHLFFCYCKIFILVTFLQGHFSGPDLNPDIIGFFVVETVTFYKEHPWMTVSVGAPQNLPIPTLNDMHCVKSVQRWSFVLSVFSCVRTEYGDLLCKSPYSVRLQKNTDQKNLRIWTLFTQ